MLCNMLKKIFVNVLLLILILELKLCVAFFLESDTITNFSHIHFMHMYFLQNINKNNYLYLTYKFLQKILKLECIFNAMNICLKFMYII